MYYTFNVILGKYGHTIERNKDWQALKHGTLHAQVVFPRPQTENKNRVLVHLILFCGVVILADNTCWI